MGEGSSWLELLHRRKDEADRCIMQGIAAGDPNVDPMLFSPERDWETAIGHGPVSPRWVSEQSLPSGSPERGTEELRWDGRVYRHRV